jgi:hypothetical protein
MSEEERKRKLKEAGIEVVKDEHVRAVNKARNKVSRRS